MTFQHLAITWYKSNVGEKYAAIGDAVSSFSAEPLAATPLRSSTFFAKKAKHMSISSTTVVISSTGAEYNLPGDQTVEAIKTIYGAAIPGLASMTAQEVVEDDVKVVTFSQATGTKGA